MRFRKLQQKTALLILTAVVLLGTFGVVGTAFLNHTEMQHCPFVSMYIGDCTVAKADTAFVFHHMEGFQAFLQSTVTAGAASVLALIIFTFGAACLFSVHIAPIVFYYTKYVLHVRQYMQPPVVWQFRQWLVLQGRNTVPDKSRALGYFA